MHRQDFVLPKTTYLLNHSVGRPLASSQAAFEQSFLAPWQDLGREPWQAWLGVIEQFSANLARLLNSQASQFCPQVNLSSGLTKLLMSLPQLQRKGVKLLMSEIDFPSMGFVLQKALPDAEICFVPKAADVTDIQVWQQYLTADMDLVFISHAYSNTGQQAPIEAIAAMARQHQVLSVVDIAQSVGVIPIDLARLQADFVIGSSVKWLCGGPGAAYLWVSEAQLEQCQPMDVGWFSHDNPFEFDIHQFRYHPTALRFWGGTPSVAPYAFASHSIGYFSDLGAHVVREHNQALISLAMQQLGELCVSPMKESQRNGTLIVDLGQDNQTALTALTQADISVDVREAGLRISPHIYNTADDMAHLVEVITSVK
ncbi:aminotransferase class V-fold PLP-dependent enzyme [Shewanella waksmanii]|uniref:aminotransferase class V-fold PLP-dependent enzyme n=1 Tax=Shewanella waksmanii TaxID=213783 RepID=UPI003735035E